jgi:hypothetical protein
LEKDEVPLVELLGSIDYNLPATPSTTKSQAGSLDTLKYTYWNWERLK